MSRLEEVIRQTPPTTLFILSLCILLHVLRIATSHPALSSVTFCPRLVLYQGDAYRIVTGALYHGDIVHLAVNSMSTMAIGSLLEKQLGSLRLFITILWSIVLTAIVYIIIALLAWKILDHNGLMQQHSVGFSSVLFHLVVLECNLQQLSSFSMSRNLFGFIQVDAKYYPLVLLIVLQILMPGLSFTGHLSGIVVGYLHCWGCGHCLCPRESYLREMDSWSFLERIPSFVRTTSTTTTTPMYFPDSFRVVHRTFGSCWKKVCSWLGREVPTRDNFFQSDDDPSDPEWASLSVGEDSPEPQRQLV